MSTSYLTEKQKAKYGKTHHGVFDVLSDPIGDEIFKIVGSNGGFSKYYIISNMESKPSTKQLYGRLSRLKEAGLVRSEAGKYTMTAYGRVIYRMVEAIEEATAAKPRLRALEVALVTPDIPKEEWDELAKKLITNEQVRRLAFE
jgi:DNA-binding PadR family transcriptional regulator